LKQKIKTDMLKQMKETEGTEGIEKEVLNKLD